jgi:hypothetical protein
LQSSLEALAYSNQSHLIEGIGKLPGGLPKPLGCILMPLLTSIRLSSDQISRCVEWAEILDLLQLVQRLGDQAQFEVTGGMADPFGRPHQLFQIHNSHSHGSHGFR